MTAATLAPELTTMLDQLVADLRAAAGDRLRGVAVYGGLAKGRYTPGISDINLLVMVDAADFRTLGALAEVLTPARRRDRVAALVLTPDELAEFGRLFPVKLADIQAAHRVLAGEPGLAALGIDPPALALRLRQELRNLELRFRQTVLERGAEPAVLWRRLTATLPRLAVALEAVLRQRGADAPRRRGDILRAAAAALAVPPEHVEPFARIHREDPTPPDDRVRELASAYLSLLHLLADRVESPRS